LNFISAFRPLTPMTDLPYCHDCAEIAKPREVQTRIKDCGSDPRTFFKTAAG